ncbi:potassium channel protein [Peribacillus glennii]|uniref:Potassium channel protein n=1 Tax=Peribacillus glennii TaxID=2303991 RepID=A0A372LF63_9BACI|nr:potassium channel family protein [Peribacillus glennii]RFU64928.1 potassium channel protein [Peribacillus glennii]
METIRKILFNLIKVRARIFFPFFLIYIITAAFIAFYLEPTTFGSLLTSFYWVLTTLATIGFGDYAPVTDAGKIFTMCLYITGIGLISVFIAKIVQFVNNFEKRRVGGKMDYTGKDHVILIGWSNKSKIATEEILQSDANTDTVIISNLEKSPWDHDRVFYVRGDATDHATLMRANLPKAKGVIIFADQITQDHKDPLLVDGKTLLVATAITSIEEEMNLSIHVTAEVLDQHHIRLFKHVKVDEFVPTQEMISQAAVSSLFHHGVTRMYTELMSKQYDEGMHEIQRRPEWKTYRDAFIDLLDKGATLVADHSDLHINKKLHHPIPEDAQLFVICDKETLKKLNTDHNIK